MGAVAAMRVLVAYYSLSGYTASLAEATAAALRADGSGGHEVELLEIVPAKPYSYFTAGVKGVTQAMSGTIVELLTPVPESGAYDAIVILSPTWGWMSSPPVRSFVAHLSEGEGRPAVVGVTHAGGPIGSFDRLAALVAERGYDVRERLSVFCYSADAIAGAAAQTVTALGTAGDG
jgi:multimeric flavodoxin WrbA